MLLTLLELQSHFGDNPVKFEVVCPQIGTAVLKGLRIGTCLLLFSCGARLTPAKGCRRCNRAGLCGAAATAVVQQSVPTRGVDRGAAPSIHPSFSVAYFWFGRELPEHKQTNGHRLVRSQAEWKYLYHVRTAVVSRPVYTSTGTAVSYQHLCTQRTKSIPGTRTSICEEKSPVRINRGVGFR